MYSTQDFITSTYLAILALWASSLAIYIIIFRRTQQVPLQDGGSEILARRIRAFANCMEYSPIYFLLIFFAEMKGLHPLAVHVFCWVFLLGRFLHPFAMFYKQGELRVLAMSCTFTCIISLALYLLGLSFLGALFF